MYIHIHRYIYIYTILYSAHFAETQIVYKISINIYVCVCVGWVTCWHCRKMFRQSFDDCVKSYIYNAYWKLHWTECTRKWRCTNERIVAFEYDLIVLRFHLRYTQPFAITSKGVNSADVHEVVTIHSYVYAVGTRCT